MKKLLAGLAVALFACALAIPAWADVDARVDVRVSKDVRIVEFIGKLKFVLIGVLFLEQADGAAESLALVNQENEDNDAEVDLDTDEGFAEDSLDALIKDGDVGGSISGNKGITQVNQDVGVGPNQANVAVVAVTDAATSVVDAQSAMDQRNRHNDVDLRGPFDTENPAWTAKIINSVNGNDGITQVNQNAGYWSNQANALSVALGEEDGAILALSDAFLGQVNHGNDVEAFTTVKTNVISGSVSNNNGVTNVNQNTGNMNNQGTTISFAGITGLGLNGNVSQLP
jgi:hypothetical protein